MLYGLTYMVLLNWEIMEIRLQHTFFRMERTEEGRVRKRHAIQVAGFCRLWFSRKVYGRLLIATEVQIISCYKKVRLILL